MKLNRYKRELSAALAYLALLIAVAIVAPSFFSATNLRDLAQNNAPVLLVSMPFAPLYTPSLGLSLLQASLAVRGISAHSR